MSFLKVQFSHQRLTMQGDIYSKICSPYFSSPITPEKKDSLLSSPGSDGSNWWEGSPLAEPLSLIPMNRPRMDKSR